MMWQMDLLDRGMCSKRFVRAFLLIDLLQFLLHSKVTCLGAGGADRQGSVHPAGLLALTSSSRACKRASATQRKFLRGMPTAAMGMGEIGRSSTKLYSRERQGAPKHLRDSTHDSQSPLSLIRDARLFQTGAY